MDIETLIREDLAFAFPTVFNIKTGVEVDFLLEASHPEIRIGLEALQGLEGIIEEERHDLLNFLILAEKLEDGIYIIDYEKELLLTLEKYPLLSFRFFLFLYQVEGLVENGFDPDELIRFYESIFSYPELVDLNDFFSGSMALTPLLLAPDIPDPLMTIFKKSIQDHPDKVILKFICAHLHDKRNEPESAIEMNIKFIEQLNTTQQKNPVNDQRHYTGDWIHKDEEYIFAMTSLAELHYKIGQYDISLDFSNILLNKFDKDEQDIHSFQYLYVNPSVMKLRCFMQQGNTEDFVQAFNALHKKIDKDDLELMNIRDIINYSQNLQE